MRSGTPSRPRTLWVTSSPTRPLPRVSARDQAAAGVLQDQGQAVDLGLDAQGQIVGRIVAAQGAHRGDLEVAHLGRCIGFLQRERGVGVGDGHQFAADLAQHLVRLAGALAG